MAENKEEESSKRVIYTYPMVKQTDMPDDMKVKLLETSNRYNLKLQQIYILIPAFYLIIWLMKSTKNFETISILKI